MPTHFIFVDEDNLLVAGRGIHQHDPAYDGDTDTESEAEQADAEASRWRGRHPQRWKRTVPSIKGLHIWEEKEAEWADCTSSCKR